MLVSPQDWAQIETGVLQRARLLNGIMADVYGERELLKRAPAARRRWCKATPATCAPCRA